MSPFNIYSNMTFEYIKSFMMYEFWGIISGVLPKIIKITPYNTETFNTIQAMDTIL
jgi:hypothetical protein